MAGFDMHVHSTASDGANAPAALVTMAKEQGLLGMALTDHDTCLLYTSVAFVLTLIGFGLMGANFNLLGIQRYGIDISVAI